MVLKNSMLYTGNESPLVFTLFAFWYLSLVSQSIASCLHKARLLPLATHLRTRMLSSIKVIRILFNVNVLNYR
jgi:hypothetical protein